MPPFCKPRYASCSSVCLYKRWLKRLFAELLLRACGLPIPVLTSLDVEQLRVNSKSKRHIAPRCGQTKTDGAECRHHVRPSVQCLSVSDVDSKEWQWLGLVSSRHLSRLTVDTPPVMFLMSSDLDFSLFELNGNIGYFSLRNVHSNFGSSASFWCVLKETDIWTRKTYNAWFVGWARFNVPLDTV